MSDVLKIAMGRFAKKVKKRAKMMIESPRTINGRNVRRVATGTLANSLRSKVSRDRIEFSSAKQGIWVEQGRKPSAKLPPLEAIKAWILAKGIMPRDKATGRFVERTPARLNGMAFMIGRKVAKKGYPGIFFYSTSIKRELEKPNNDISEGSRKAIAEQLRKKLAKGGLK